MNLFIFRDILQNDGTIQEYISKKYGLKEASIRYSNVGFIIVPNNTDYVIKYYMPDLYISDKSGENQEYNLFEKEKVNYFYFKENDILIPKYISSGEVNIGNYIFKYAKIENVRINSKKIVNFNTFNINKFVSFIYKIHSMKPGYIHGSIHTSDFFLIKSGQIGIFDLVNYYKGDIEVDLARICYGYNLDIYFIKSFLLLYGIEKINLSKLMLEIFNLSKLHNYRKDDFFKTIYLIKRLNTIYNGI